MQALTISDGTNTFTRISKAEARKRFAEGLPLTLCPVKLRPGYPWAPQSTVFPEGWTERDYSFESMLNEWAYYNTSYEAGYYAAYYVEVSE